MLKTAFAKVLSKSVPAVAVLPVKLIAYVCALLDALLNVTVWIRLLPSTFVSLPTVKVIGSLSVIVPVPTAPPTVKVVVSDTSFNTSFTVL